MVDRLGLLGWVALCFATAALGGWWTAGSVHTWYPALLKPAWNPPAWLFGPVWTVLYLMMGVAAWRVWRHRGEPGVQPALAWFVVQLVLNAAWSGLFFGLRNPGAAAAEICFLWGAIAIALGLSGRIDRWAAALLVPYLAWVSFALLLNFELWRLNR